MRRRSRRVAFTLVELLVVITIIGILIALLLPAVQAAREAARRMQCGNNFKQVGVALHNYHAAHECFPPGWIRLDAGEPAACGPTTTSSYNGWGWGCFILPYMEQEGIYSMIDFGAAGAWYGPPAQNLAASQTKISGYLCPSDVQEGELVLVYDTQVPSAAPRQTNMTGVSDSVTWSCPDPVAGPWGKQYPVCNGVFGERRGCQISEIRDGTSNTLMVGENTGGGKGTNLGYFWASWDVADTSNGINGFLSVPGGGKWTTAGQNAGFSSWHSGGCNFLLCDGSVSFVSQNIGTASLAALTTRDGAAVDKVLLSGPP